MGDLLHPAAAARRRIRSRLTALWAGAYGWSAEPRADAFERAQARVALVEDPRPDAGEVGGVDEQPRHGRRRDLHGRGGAPARAAPARAPDHAPVRLHLDLDQRRLLRADRRVGLPATGAGAGLLGRGVLLDAFLEPGPRGAAVAGGAANLTARPSGARPLTHLAPASVQRPGQHRTGRAELRDLRLLRPGLAPQFRHGSTQPRVLVRQSRHRGLAPPRPSQRRIPPGPQSAMTARIPTLGKALPAGLARASLAVNRGASA